MDGGVWQAAVHRVTESDMTEVTQHTYEIQLSFVKSDIKEL